MNYYNENDPKAAAWLRELIKEGHISNGIVDERSIVDVQPNDLHEYKQCHFFAGIGGWSYALRLAGIPDDKPVWTGSCPCPPFSAAGKKKNCLLCGDKTIPHPRKTGVFACIGCAYEWLADGRHLWPEFCRLIHKRNPSTVFGEQVAGEDGEIWLAGVRATLEKSNYLVGAADLCAAGSGAPQLRQRLWWVAHTDGRQCGNGELQRSREHRQQQENNIADRLEHATSNGREQRRTEPSGRSVASGCGVGGMGDTDKPGPQGRNERRNGSHQWTPWEASVALPCTDGKTRRIEPGTFPLAHGVSDRVGLLRGYGNAIVPQVAAEFIQAFYEAHHDVRSDVLMADPMF